MCKGGGRPRNICLPYRWGLVSKIYFLIVFLCTFTDITLLFRKKMELNDNWVDIFRTALVCIEEFDDPVQAVKFAWQLYNTGEQFFNELEDEGTAIEIYKHCSYLLDLINKKGVRSQYFYF